MRVGLFSIGLLLHAQIAWQPLSQEASKGFHSQRMLFIYIYAPWCSLCHMMEQNVLSHPAISSYVNRNFTPLRINAEGKDTLFYRDTYFRYLPELQIHELAYLLLEGKMEYPAMVFVEPSGQVLFALRAYLTAKQLDVLLHYFASGAYRDTSWETYEQVYVSNL
ncbi:MAG: thioredoxin family protein [Bacteroidia bacterium]